MNTLGEILKATRLKLNKKLREVEEMTGISNAYLSQLENDKIKSPSANTLYKLASAYNIEIDELLYAAGIIENRRSKSNSDIVEKFAFHAEGLSEHQQEEVIDFIKYLKFKKGNS